MSCAGAVQGRGSRVVFDVAPPCNHRDYLDLGSEDPQKERSPIRLSKGHPVSVISLRAAGAQAGVLWARPRPARRLMG
jgi:hypothetical protein